MESDRCLDDISVRQVVLVSKENKVMFSNRTLTPRSSATKRQTRVVSRKFCEIKQTKRDISSLVSLLIYSLFECSIQFDAHAIGH